MLLTCYDTGIKMETSPTQYIQVTVCLFVFLWQHELLRFDSKRAFKHVWMHYIRWPWTKVCSSADECAPTQQGNASTCLEHRKSRDSSFIRSTRNQINIKRCRIINIQVPCFSQTNSIGVSLKSEYYFEYHAYFHSLWRRTVHEDFMEQFSRVKV